jgi:hypothetical protein
MQLMRQHTTAAQPCEFLRAQRHGRAEAERDRQWQHTRHSRACANGDQVCRGTGQAFAQMALQRTPAFYIRLLLAYIAPHQEHNPVQRTWPPSPETSAGCAAP